MTERPYIFLSHAHADKPVADALVSLLSEGANVTSDRILCTSLDGRGLDTGTESIAAVVREELVRASLVITLVSEMYLVRPYCLCELGGAWASKRRLFPTTLGKAASAELSGILTDSLARPLRETSTLDELYDRVNRFVHAEAGTAPTPTALWNGKRDRFVQVLQSLEQELTLPDLVGMSELHEAQRQTEALVGLINERDVEIRRLGRLTESLKEATTKHEADRMELESLGELDRFRAAVTSAYKMAGRLPNVVLDVTYHEAVGDTYEVDYGYPDTVLDLKDAAQRRLIHLDGPTAEPDYSTGPMKRLAKALTILKDFLETMSEEFYEWYENEYDRPPTLDDREFWETHFELR